MLSVAARRISAAESPSRPSSATRWWLLDTTTEPTLDEALAERQCAGQAMYQIEATISNGIVSNVRV